MILAVLKHSGKIPYDNEFLKSIESIEEIRVAKINNFFTIRGRAGK